MTNGATGDMWLRSTVCLRKNGDEWRIAHEHTAVPFAAEGGGCALGLAPKTEGGDPMPEREPGEATNLDRYGNAVLPWSRPRDLLAGSAPGPEVPMFLSTTRPDGRPHTAGIGVAWRDDDLYFTSNPETRKSRNLATNPACTVAMRLPGIDLVFEGEAARTTDPAKLAALAALFREGGWPAEAAGDAITAPFSAPSAGPPPWHLYRFTFHTAFGVATAEPWGAARWRFGS